MKSILLVCFLACIAGACGAPALEPKPLEAKSVAGVVRGEAGPLAGAVVRWQATEISAVTDERGRFRLPLHESGRITASHSGYFIAGASPDGNPLVITLKPIPREDHHAYAWVDPRPAAEHAERCGNCHEDYYRQWSSSGHAAAATNPRLLNLISGENARGEPGHGWSLAQEYPQGIGVCVSCHAPGLDFEGGADDDLRTITGVAAQGVHCDFCHKISAVTEDASLGLAHGRYGYELLRPQAGQIFFGPLDDVDRGEDVHSPLQSRSRYCAACHEGTLFGVPVYTTYSEWLKSPARKEGKQCQTCHQPPSGITNVAAQGGRQRDPATLSGHSFLPGGRLAMLRGSLHVSVESERSENQVDLRVNLVARNAGHRVPTGFIDRHLILVVQAQDDQGNQIAATSGPLLPILAGEEMAGQSGKLFGRLLKDEQGNMPVPFWRTVEEVEDTRLHPDQWNSTKFVFPSGAAAVRIRILYRRFWSQVAHEKEWPDETLTVVDAEHELE